MKIVCQNKKAEFEYYLLECFNAGVVLTGDEIKSVRSGHISINETFITIRDNIVILKNCYIKPYENSYNADRISYDSRRDKVLLLNKSEIKKLEKAKEQDGLTIIPTKAYFSGSYLKIELYLAKGKHLYDKKNAIKEKDIAKSNQRLLR